MDWTVVIRISSRARRERLEALLRELDGLGCGWRLDLAGRSLECRKPGRPRDWVRVGGFAGLLSKYPDCVRIDSGAPARPRWRRPGSRLPGGAR